MEKTENVNDDPNILSGVTSRYLVKRIFRDFFARGHRAIWLWMALVIIDIFHAARRHGGEPGFCHWESFGHFGHPAFLSGGATMLFSNKDIV